MPEKRVTTTMMVLGNWELPFIGSIGLLLFGANLAFWMKPGEELDGLTLDAKKKLAVA